MNRTQISTQVHKRSKSISGYDYYRQGNSFRNENCQIHKALTFYG